MDGKKVLVVFLPKTTDFEYNNALSIISII